MYSLDKVFNKGYYVWTVFILWNRWFTIWRCKVMLFFFYFIFKKYRRFECEIRYDSDNDDKYMNGKWFFFMLYNGFLWRRNCDSLCRSDMIFFLIDLVIRVDIDVEWSTWWDLIADELFSVMCLLWIDKCNVILCRKDIGFVSKK